jgi:hypothetical protein
MNEGGAQQGEIGNAARPWRALSLVFALFAAGCQQAQLERLVHDSPACSGECGDLSSRLGREVGMNRRWQNHRSSELTSVLGAPRLIMNIPGGGNPPGFVAVYGQDPVSGCIDAFAFTYDTDPLIRVYHCR